MQCLVVVAHPDDETIWMGGTILKLSDCRWHVMALCRGDDTDRAPRFLRAAEALGVQAYISDLDDGSPKLAQLSDNLHEIKCRVAPLAARGFDLIFTHGENGEYGHTRHRQVHRAVREMIESGEARGDLVYFDYRKVGSSCVPCRDAQVLLELTPDEHVAKQHIVRDIYGFRPGSFEYESAGLVEAFYASAQAGFQLSTLLCSSFTHIGG
ncbi:MAG: PIG-L family deacetylase [Armatimonadetes bacterium]|nr:PIG-L family deacetylase [Armatimonadota bacterium]